MIRKNTYSINTRFVIHIRALFLLCSDLSLLMGAQSSFFVVLGLEPPDGRSKFFVLLCSDLSLPMGAQNSSVQLGRYT